MKTLVERKNIMCFLALGLVLTMVVGSHVMAGSRRRNRRQSRSSARARHSEIKGVVISFDAADPNVFYILNDLVAIDASNARVHGTAKNIDEIWEGDEVQIKGTYDAASSTILAIKIEVKGPTKDGELEGYLAAVDPLNGTVTLLGQVIDVDDLTLIEDRHHVVLTLYDLYVGQKVKIDVIVDFNSDNPLYAAKIEANGNGGRGSNSGDNGSVSDNNDHNSGDNGSGDSVGDNDDDDSGDNSSGDNVGDNDDDDSSDNGSGDSIDDNNDHNSGDNSSGDSVGDDDDDDSGDNSSGDSVGDDDDDDSGDNGSGDNVDDNDDDDSSDDSGADDHDDD